MNHDLVKRLTDIWLGGEIDNNGIFIAAAKRIEALETALDDIIIYSDDDTAVKIARDVLEEEYDK